MQNPTNDLVLTAIFEVGSGVFQQPQDFRNAFHTAIHARTTGNARPSVVSVNAWTSFYEFIEEKPKNDTHVDVSNPKLDALFLAAPENLSFFEYHDLLGYVMFKSLYPQLKFTQRRYQEVRNEKARTLQDAERKLQARNQHKD